MGGNAEPLDGNYKPVETVLVAGVGYVVQQGSSVTGIDSVTGQQYAPTLIQSSNKNFAIAAGTGTTPAVVKAGAGYLKTIVVTTTATAAMTFYDNATAASGTILYATTASVAAGTIIVLDMPFTNGLTASQASGSAAVTLAYI